MRSRLISIVAAVALVVACNPALDGFSDGTSSEESDASPPAKDAAADGSSSTSDSGTQDAKVDGGDESDAAPDASCRANGAGCSRGSSCCSGSCNQAQTCVASCLDEGAGGCSIGGSSCCSGTYCSAAAGTKCIACLPAGATPEAPGDASSCCSHQLFNGKCGDN